MSRTLWEEGRWSGDRVTRLAVVLCALLVGLDLLAHGRLIFDVGFALVCVGAALAVRPVDFFRVGVLPPMLLLGCSVAISLVARDTVAAAGDGFVQGTVSALARHAGSLAAGYGLALAVLAIRHHVIGRRSHSNRLGSPAPYRTISGAPAEKSTTVVGSLPTTPESRTASRR